MGVVDKIIAKMNNKAQPLSISFSDVQISIDNYYCYHQEAPQCWTNLSAF